MIVVNTKEIRAILKDFPALANLPVFTIDGQLYDRLFAEAKQQHPEEGKHQLHLRTIKRSLTLDRHKPEPLDLKARMHEFAEQQWWTNAIVLVITLVEIMQCFLLAELIHVVAK